MKLECDWNSKQSFVANINGFRIHINAMKSFAENKISAPKQLVLATLCSNTGVNIIYLLRKHKQEPTKFKIEAETGMTNDYQLEHRKIKIKYLLDGVCEKSKVLEAVDLSQTHYCDIGSMLSNETTIAYAVSLNGKQISQDESHFKRQHQQFSNREVHQ